MKKYLIPRSLLKEIIENPIRACYAPGRVLEYTCPKTGNKVQLGALEDQNEEITDPNGITNRTTKTNKGRSRRLLFS